MCPQSMEVHHGELQEERLSAGHSSQSAGESGSSAGDTHTHTHAAAAELLAALRL